MKTHKIYQKTIEKFPTTSKSITAIKTVIFAAALDRAKLVTEMGTAATHILADNTNALIVYEIAPAIIPVNVALAKELAKFMASNKIIVEQNCSATIFITSFQLKKLQDCFRKRLVSLMNLRIGAP